MHMYAHFECSSAYFSYARYSPKNLDQYYNYEKIGLLLIARFSLADSYNSFRYMRIFFIKSHSLNNKITNK